MKVYPVLGRVSVPVIQYLITPANVAAQKIECIYENWINYESVPSSRTRLCASDPVSHNARKCGGTKN